MKVLAKIMLTLLLASVLTLPSNIQPVQTEVARLEYMPDFGQHSGNWCWVAAAANCFYWLKHHGDFPDLYPDSWDGNATESLNTSNRNWYCNGCDSGYRRLLKEICQYGNFVHEETLVFCSRFFLKDPGWRNYVDLYVLCLEWLIADQGFSDRLVVHKYDNPTFEDYKREINAGSCVIILYQWGGPEDIHLVTGVSFDTNESPSEIEVSDPGTPPQNGSVNHNNDPDLRIYDKWEVTSEDTFKANSTYTVHCLFCISPHAHAWPMFQHDPQRTGRSPYVGPDSTELRVQTLFKVAEGTYNGPIVNVAIGLDGTIYFRGSAPGRGTGLFAIHPNGTEKWFLSFDTHASEGGHPTLGPDGTIYCLSSDGILAVNSNGTLRWDRGIAVDYTRQHFVIADDGILYFVAGVVLPNGSVAAPCMVALDSGGELVWIFDIEDEIVWYLSPDYDMEQGWGSSSDTNEVTSPSIGPEGNIYIGYRGTLWSISPNGTKNWQETLPETYFQSGGPAISSEGVIYVATNKLYAINSSGDILWHTNLTGGIRSPPAIGPGGTLYTFESRYSPSGRYWLTAIDAQGEVKWQNYTGRAHGIPIVDEEGNVFTALYSIAGPYEVARFSSSGDLLWKLRLPELIVSSTGLALNREGTLFVPGIELYAIQARPHDTAVTSITVSKTIVGEGYSLQINVSVKNEGDFHESFNVSAYANDTLIETQRIDNLPNGTSTVITFTWPRTCVTYGNYTIRIYAWLVQGEKDIFDNAYTDGIILVTIAGDVNGDRWVDAADLSDLNKAYSSTGQYPNCDLNGDNKVDASDLFDLSKNYGKTV